MAVLAERITVNPDQCGGRPCVRGLRIRVTDVLDLLASGLSPECPISNRVTCLRVCTSRADVSIIPSSQRDALARRSPRGRPPSTARRGGTGDGDSEVKRSTLLQHLRKHGCAS